MVDLQASEKPESQDRAMSLVAAMTLSCALIIGFNWGGLADSLFVPLSDEVARSAEDGGLLVMKLVLFAIFCWQGMTTSVFLLGAISVFYSWVAMYSATGAFFPQVIFNCLLLAASLRPGVSPQNRKAWAASFLSIVFTVAALQKINANYLSGYEFQSIRGFIGPFRYHFGELPKWLAVDTLPWLSIVIELGIGIGVLFRPRMFSQLAVGFILFLFLINPHLHLPYLTVAVLSILIFPESGTFISGYFSKVKIDSAFFWSFILVAMSNLRSWINRNPIEFYALPWIFSLTFLWIHGQFFVQTLKCGGFRNDQRIRAGDFSLRQNKFVGALLAVMLLTPIGYNMGLPGPIGFSMFSAQQKRFGGSQMKVQGEAACFDIERNLLIFITTDVVFRRDSGGCKIIAPTQSGLNNLKRKICRRFASGHLPAQIIDGSQCSVE